MKLGVRHAVAGWAFAGMMITYMIRVNLSVAIVAMSAPLPESLVKGTSECPGFSNRTRSAFYYGTYLWDRQTQGVILSSFYIGYICLQIPTGWIVRYLGAKSLFGGGLLAASLLAMLTPAAAEAGANYLILVRVLMGLCEGTTWPANHALWAAWAPDHENTRLLNFVFSGTHLGSILSLLLTGFLVQHGPWGGWSSAFYLFGGAGVIWFIGWLLFVSSRPEDHSRITRAELELIKQTSRSQGPTAVPWRALLRSRGVWAVTIAHGLFNWPFYTMLAGLPLYLSDQLHMDGDSIGLASSLPYCMLFVAQTLSSVAADRARHYVSTTLVRKVTYSGGLILSSIFLGLVCFAGCSVALSLTLLTLSLTFAGVAYSGFSPLHLDMAPQYAGLLMGISNTAGTVSGIAAPAVMGRLLEDGGNWSAVFLLSAAIGTLSALIFAFLGTAERQKWASDGRSSPLLSDTDGDE